MERSCCPSGTPVKAATKPAAAHKNVELKRVDFTRGGILGGDYVIAAQRESPYRVELCDWGAFLCPDVGMTWAPFLVDVCQGASSAHWR